MTKTCDRTVSLLENPWFYDESDTTEIRSYGTHLKKKLYGILQNLKLLCKSTKIESIIA